jgi:hypothetical protein
LIGTEQGHEEYTALAKVSTRGLQQVLSSFMRTRKSSFGMWSLIVGEISAISLANFSPPVLNERNRCLRKAAPFPVGLAPYRIHSYRETVVKTDEARDRADHWVAAWNAHVNSNHRRYFGRIFPAYCTEKTGDVAGYTLGAVFHIKKENSASKVRQ